jgi:AraC-like DNA-binding protein
MTQWDDSWSAERKLAWVDARLVEIERRIAWLLGRSGGTADQVDEEIHQVEAILESDEQFPQGHPMFRALDYLGAQQREFAVGLREVIEMARARGFSWDLISQALGMERTTLYRQYVSGGPINTVRATHRKKESQ